MVTMRAWSAALALGVLGVAPSAAQQPQHREGHQYPTGERTPGMMADQGMCMMRTIQMEPTLQPPAGTRGQQDHAAARPACPMPSDTVGAEPQIADPTPESVVRTRRPSGPSRIGAAAAASRTARVNPARHADRERVRRFTGPTRFPPAIVAWHDVAPTGGADAERPRSARRADGALTDRASVSEDGTPGRGLAGRCRPASRA